MAEQIRALIRGSGGRRSRAARRRAFATLGSVGRGGVEPRDPRPVVTAERPAPDRVDHLTFAFGFLQGLFLGRIVLALISVGRAFPVAAVILALSDPLVEPFRTAAYVDPTSAMPLLDVPALLALIVWTLVETVCLATICVRDQRRRAGDPAPRSRVRVTGWASSMAKSR